MKNIVLCGFMGCGKTTVGKRLAKRCGRKFVDMDKYIEEQENMTVSQIFERHGEAYFRDAEHKACCALAKQENLVIASGGGALTFQRNIDAFKGKDTVLLISVPLPVLQKRLEKDTTRPLLQRPDKEQAMRELYEKRMPLYTQAASVVVDGAHQPDAVARLIIATMGLNRKKSKKT